MAKAKRRPTAKSKSGKAKGKGKRTNARRKLVEDGLNYAAFHDGHQKPVGPWRATHEEARSDLGKTFIIMKTLDSGVARSGTTTVGALVATMYAAYCEKDQKQVGVWRTLLSAAKSDASAHETSTGHPTTTIERESV